MVVLAFTHRNDVGLCIFSEVRWPLCDSSCGGQHCGTVVGNTRGPITPNQLHHKAFCGKSDLPHWNPSDPLYSLLFHPPESLVQIVSFIFLARLLILILTSLIFHGSNDRGNGDGHFSSLFQTALVGNALHNATSPEVFLNIPFFPQLQYQI
jgi:hypothetical protein